MTVRERLALWSVGLATPLAFLALVRLLPSPLNASTAGVVTREVVLIVVSAGWLALLAKGFLTASALGLGRPRWRDLGWGGAAAVLTILLSVTVAVILRRFGVDVGGENAVKALASRPSWLILLIALTAAFTEEVVFRAVLIPCIVSASGRAWIAILVSAIYFAVPHATAYGSAKIFVALVPGFVMAGLFVWRRSLAACVVAHSLIDIVGLAGLLFAGR